MENKIIFPLSEEDQDKYYDHSAIDRTNGTAFDIYKIDNTYYDVLGNKVNQDGSELKEGKLEEASSNEPDEIKEIRKFFDDLIKEKGVSPDELLDNGAIYYMNGNVPIKKVYDFLIEKIIQSIKGHIILLIRLGNTEIHIHYKIIFIHELFDFI